MPSTPSRRAPTYSSQEALGWPGAPWQYLGVCGGLIGAGAAAVEVSELVLLVDSVEALAAGTACHMLTDAVIPFLFLS